MDKRISNRQIAKLVLFGIITWSILNSVLLTANNTWLTQTMPRLFERTETYMLSGPKQYLDLIRTLHVLTLALYSVAVSLTIYCAINNKRTTRAKIFTWVIFGCYAVMLLFVLIAYLAIPSSNIQGTWDSGYVSYYEDLQAVIFRLVAFTGMLSIIATAGTWKYMFKPTPLTEEQQLEIAKIKAQERAERLNARAEVDAVKRAAAEARATAAAERARLLEVKMREEAKTLEEARKAEALAREAEKVRKAKEREEARILAEKKRILDERQAKMDAKNKAYEERLATVNDIDTIHGTETKDRTNEYEKKSGKK